MVLKIGALVFLVSAVLVALSAILPEESQNKVKAIFLSDEQKVLFAECEQVRKQLKEQGLPSQFSSVDYRVRDQRLEKDPILKDLVKCFPSSPKSNLKLEVELFSSDYQNESSADLQVQISAFDVKSKNKVAELGFRMDHEPYVTESSQEEDPPKEEAKAPAPKEEAKKTN